MGDLNCNALFEGYPDHIMKEFFEDHIFEKYIGNEKEDTEYDFLRLILNSSNKYNYENITLS